MTTRTPTTIVLGAGAVGLASAYHLRRAGCEVTVIDPEPLAARASGHNAGWLIPSMSTPVPEPGVLPQALKWMTKKDSPLYVSPSADPHYAAFLLKMLRNCTASRFEKGAATLAALSSTALSDIAELRADGVEFEHHADPLTMLFTDGHKVDHRIAELKLIEKSLPGFSWQQMTEEDLRAHVPAVSDKVVAGIESVGDQSVDPASYVRGLAAACEREGVELRLGEQGTLVSGPGGEVSVQVGGTRLKAEKIVVAAGVWTPGLLAGIGERIPLQAGKGYGYDLPVTADAPTKPMYLAEGKVAITPLDTKIRLAGTMGFGPINEGVDEVRAGGIITNTREYFSGWGALDTPPEPWSGLRPTTPDGVPVIGPLAQHPDVLVASGHVMLGISLSATTGKLITGFATGNLAADAHPDLSPNRF
ncbi:FAD-dependent oxidoreductase [Corynebacterium nuruki]|uniref:FAD-dependent oxidoreductase n=1 Tax=Corynebacterium nuruki TaxID=1032851 RepID=A0A3D4SWM1_9CORY|nr:FAD-dependent oxidoreductase [Corynebacterium nuruki]HCT13684.1 FAD-dependent oxidoreductase [Corynebacterium nuruki]